jgi:putative hydrolase of the HAD superfamily
MDENILKKIAELKQRSHWISDLDGTLYPYHPSFNDSIGFHEHVDLAIAEVAITLGFNGSLAEAKEIAKRSYTDHGHSAFAFELKHGLSLSEMYNRMHDKMDIMQIRLEPNELVAIQDFRDIILNPNSTVKDTVILTASSPEWAHRAVERIGLSSIYNHEAGKIITSDDCIDPITGKHTFKDQHHRPYDVALERLGVPAKLCAMFEDSARNLRIPHEMGIFTVYVHHGDPIKPEKMPDFIDLQIRDMSELKQLTMG